MSIRTRVQSKMANLSDLAVFYPLNDNILIKKLKRAILAGDEDIDPGDILNHLLKNAEKNNLNGDLWTNYLLELIVTAENLFTLGCERQILSSEQSLYQACIHDMEILKELLSFQTPEIMAAAGQQYIQQFKMETENYQPLEESAGSRAAQNYSRKLPELEGDGQQMLETLNQYYHRKGAGRLNKYRAFLWDSARGLQPVKNPDPVTFSDLMGYEKQKQKLINNTEAFLKDGSAQNVLLYGESGTGKSSSVKAVLNKFTHLGLRLVEVNSDQIDELPDIMEELSRRGLYFIIFMDDLSFEDFETEYKQLKNIMEGGIEACPANVRFYATSNRRHLVQEKWEDREKEIHEREMINERLSLSERFGLTILFNSPDQQQYLEIVRGIAEQEDINMPEAVLEEKALKWRQKNSGQSGRTARQFIESLRQ
ncbi:ATP-binding protein [Halarsenatibacter silvermanii]|uniref:Uncharacterized protein n=1 Tax=Halarsenatibacter silvermanii TaxID=321763 RepID=A0A1G9KR73_9FIRM|nr:ATP-binding protein [Halarsenatibacter silvermanii]SDL52152.1 hypothetical protein SAMN04488692_10583 [Halarsenatibacter silvermanii]